MNYSVKIGEHTYKVEIEDLMTRPVIAFVDGVRMEVQLDEADVSTANETAARIGGTPALPPSPIPATSAIPSGGMLNTMSVRAPIPGMVLEVSAKPGQSVEYGQVLFVIEAMKMRNSIRSSRAGIVGEVYVSIGQTVNHNQELLRFVE